MALGSNKESFVYEDDAGNNWVIKIAEDKVQNLEPSTGLLVFDPGSPPANLKGRLNPKKCRRVYASGPISATAGAATVRREFICMISSALYEKDYGQAVTYHPSDEASPLTLTTTGRRGERFSF